MASMQNKGSALAFLLVLLLMCVGACAGISALTRGTGSGVVAEESWTPSMATPGSPVASTPAPSDTPAETPSPHSEVSTPVAPTATPVPPATNTPLPSPTLTEGPTSTRPAGGATPPVPQGGNQFSVVSNELDCTAGGIIGGWVYDAGGNGLAWANLHLYNDYGWTADKQSEGPPQAGKYEFTMGFDASLFHLVIVDADGQPLSPVVDVDYRPECSQRIDWQRVQ